MTYFPFELTRLRLGDFRLGSTVVQPSKELGAKAVSLGAVAMRSTEGAESKEGFCS